MEIIKKGSGNLAQVTILSCCWPPGSEGSYSPTDTSQL